MIQTVYVSIGNSDDRLTQAEWSEFYVTTTLAIRTATGFTQMHGQWVSEPASAWQNACWCFEIEEDMAWFLKKDLASLAQQYRQDSIAWADVRMTLFLG